MKGKLLLITALTATALNVYAEGKLLKHTEQAAPNTKITLKTLKVDMNLIKDFKTHAARGTNVESLVSTTSKLTSFDFIPQINTTIIKANTSYMIWNMSQAVHAYTIGRSVCISPNNDKDPIGNCSYVNDQVYVKPNDVAYLSSEIQADHSLAAGQAYHVSVAVTVQDENSTELFESIDGQDYTAPTNQAK